MNQHLEPFMLVITKWLSPVYYSTWRGWMGLMTAKFKDKVNQYSSSRLYKTAKKKLPTSTTVSSGFSVWMTTWCPACCLLSVYLLHIMWAVSVTWRDASELVLHPEQTLEFIFFSFAGYVSPEEDFTQVRSPKTSNKTSNFFLSTF